MSRVDTLNLQIYGNTKLVRREGGEVSLDKGIFSGSLLFSCPPGKEAILAPKLYTPHPDYPFMGVEKLRIWKQGGWGWIQADYAGSRPEDVAQSDSYDLLFGTGDEPIQTHPEFAEFAGTQEAPQNGAKFDAETGKFLGFFGTGAGEFQGTESYLDASQVIWRHEYLGYFHASDCSAVGSIQSPSGPAPNLGSGRNWLFLSLESSRRGLIYRITKQWRGSGRKGWNSAIYG